MHPIVEHSPTLGGIRTRALELDGDGPPVLLLHGWADSADTWRLLLDRLRRRGRAAVALDMPGFGRADQLDLKRPVLPQLDAFVAGALEEFGAERDMVIAGNSLGGLAALRAAEVSEAPIEGVFAIAPAGLELAGWLTMIERVPVIHAIMRTPVVPSFVVRPAVGRVYRLLAYANARKVDPGVVAAFAGHNSTRDDVARIVATGRRLRGEIADPFRLDRISCPVQLVWGDRDRMVYASGAERVLREVEGSRLEMIENCGHCPQVEEPDRVAELLDLFPARRSGAVAKAV